MKKVVVAKEMQLAQAHVFQRVDGFGAPCSPPPLLRRPSQREGLAAARFLGRRNILLTWRQRSISSRRERSIRGGCEIVWNGRWKPGLLPRQTRVLPRQTRMLRSGLAIRLADAIDGYLPNHLPHAKYWDLSPQHTPAGLLLGVMPLHLETVDFDCPRGFFFWKSI
jgi:hypothetical protein